MVVSNRLLDRVEAAIALHVRSSKGFEEDSMINPFQPVDSVAAFAMARYLVQNDLVDSCIAVAPEGHVYGYFFECLDAPVLSVHVDYPPRSCQVLDDLSAIRGQRILILEDDIASGTTLRKVVTAIMDFQPKSVDLYLGRHKKDQTLENVDPAVAKIYIAEDVLDDSCREMYEQHFSEFFGYLCD